MKEVLISINPKWCELIASGKKTVEVRKTRPKLETPFKVYIYCTKGRGDCLWRWNGIWYDTQDPSHRPNRLDGKVIGEFVCDTIHEFTKAFFDEQEPQDTEEIGFWLEQFNLSYNDLRFYVTTKEFYGWHISDLVIYDKPRELSEFKQVKVIRGYHKKDEPKIEGINIQRILYIAEVKYLTRPPQSWCYVEGSKNGT